MLLNKLLHPCQELELLKARGRQRTDSTYVLAAVRDVGRLECISETMRHALNTVAEVAPTWLRSVVPSEWYERYSKRIEEYILPRNPQERKELAARVGADGFWLMEAIYSGEAPTILRQLPAVEIRAPTVVTTVLCAGVSSVFVFAVRPPSLCATNSLTL